MAIRPSHSRNQDAAANAGISGMRVDFRRDPRRGLRGSATDLDHFACVQDDRLGLQPSREATHTEHRDVRWHRVHDQVVEHHGEDRSDLYVAPEGGGQELRRPPGLVRRLREIVGSVAVVPAGSLTDHDGSPEVLRVDGEHAGRTDTTWSMLAPRSPTGTSCNVYQPSGRRESQKPATFSPVAPLLHARSSVWIRRTRDTSAPMGASRRSSRALFAAPPPALRPTSDSRISTEAHCASRSTSSIKLCPSSVVR
jgi:hypothetical protein